MCCFFVCVYCHSINWWRYTPSLCRSLQLTWLLELNWLSKTHLDGGSEGQYEVDFNNIVFIMADETFLKKSSTFGKRQYLVFGPQINNMDWCCSLTSYGTSYDTLLMITYWNLWNLNISTTTLSYMIILSSAELYLSAYVKYCVHSCYCIWI